MILATKQGQNSMAQPDSKPYTNPTPRAGGVSSMRRSRSRSHSADMGTRPRKNEGAA